MADLPFVPLTYKELAWFDAGSTFVEPNLRYQILQIVAEVRAGRRLREVASHRGTAGHEDNCAINLERKCDCWVLKLDIAVACYPAPQTEKEKP